jgi:hypothetical protein
MTPTNHPAPERDERRYYDALRNIAREYQSSDQLRRRAGQYGCSHVEELEMAYENIQALAENTIKGKRRPKS